MLVQPRKDINTLALNDPEITGGVLLPDGIWGVNLAAARLNFPDKGLKCQIPPWNNMDEGDKVELLLHGAVMDQKTIYDASEIGERVTLFVPPKRLLTGASTLSYKVTRFSQRPEEGPTLTLFVKLELPGGQDTDPDYGHSELAIAFLPENVVRDGVDKDNVKDGVVVIVAPKSGSGLPYPNAAVGDVIHVGWAGQTVLSAPLTQAQIDDPDANPVRILIDEATLLAAGDSDLAGLSVSYMIRDRVLNQSEDWCKEARIIVDTGNSRLLAPILEQADGLILDLEKLGDDLPVLKVWAEDPNEFSRGDVIVMRLTGTTAEDKSVDIVVRQSIDKNPPVEVDILHSNPGLRSLGTRSAIYSYELESGSDGKIIQRSKSRTITVVGEPTRLAAPIALDAPQGALDPDAANYRIRIPYDLSITADNAIELKWFGTRPDNTSYDPALDWYFPTEEEASDPAGFIITVEGRHGKTLEGGSLDLSYNLLSAGENDEIISRASQHAARLIVGEPKFELVPPIVLGEKDGALEPADLPGGAGKLTAPRPVARPTEANDIVTYTWFGEVSGEKVDFKKLNALSKDKDVDFTLDAAFVAQHIEPNRGKKVTVRYRIFRDASKDTSYSNVLEFVVGQAVALDPPTIDSVKGSPSGKEIVEGGTTVETSVVLSGTAAKGKNVEIRDGATVKDQVTADPVSGIWTYTASGLTVTKHSFTATGKYGAEPASAAYTLTVTTVMVPTLSNVLDDKGMEVPDRQTTVSTSLTLKGSASKGQDVEVYDGSGSGAVSKGMAKADEITGLWERTITVAVGARRLYAKSLYHSSSVYSNVRYLSVIEDIAPTIDSANGSPSGDNIPPDGITTETAVTLSGIAAKGQKVRVLDGTTNKGEPTADPATGIWTMTVTELSFAEHSFKAKALYGSGAESAVRTLTVTAATAPTLTSVKGSPSGDNIPPDGITTETAVILSGIAAKGQKVRVLDGTTNKGEPTADPATGIWTMTVTELSFAEHSFKAKALYGSGAESAVRTLTVEPAFPVLDPGADKTLNLTTFIVAEGRPPVYAPTEAIFTQAASGGIGPYKYISSNPVVASVTELTGTVTCRTNGTTRINITDANGTQASYLVTVGGIRTILRNDSTWRSWPNAHSYCISRGGRLATLAEMRAFYDLYAKERADVAALLGWPLIHNHPSALFGAWLADGGGGSHYYFNLTGTFGNSGSVPWGTNTDGYGRPALCLYG